MRGKYHTWKEEKFFFPKMTRMGLELFAKVPVTAGGRGGGLPQWITELFKTVDTPLSLSLSQGLPCFHPEGGPEPRPELRHCPLFSLSLCIHCYSKQFTDFGRKQRQSCKASITFFFFPAHQNALLHKYHKVSCTKAL